MNSPRYMYDPLFDHVFDLSYKKIPNLKILIKVDEYKNRLFTKQFLSITLREIFFFFFTTK